MELAEIQKRIDGHRTDRYEKQCRYAGGRNPAILDRKAHEEPDNRIPVPIARKGIRLVSGYMFKPGNITYSTDPEGYYADTLKPIFDVSDEELTTQEEAETVLTHGEAWEYHYKVDGKPHFVEVPYAQCIPIWDDALPPNLVGMIRHYCEMEGDEEIQEIYYWDEARARKWEGKKGAMVEITADPERGEEGMGLHGYGEVPFAQFKMARDCSNLFDCVIPIIDIMDRTVSEDWANELQRFANSYLLLANQLSSDIDDQGLNEMDKIRSARAFMDLGDDVKKKVDFLIKNVPIDFVKTGTDLFERLIYDMMNIINPNALVDASDVSGRAYAYKILMFEFLCASIETYFSRGLQWRIRLIQKALGSVSTEARSEQVTIQFRRNLPFDMASAVEQFVKLVGLLPDEIALKLFPASFIADVKAVAEEMAKNKQVPNMDTPTGAVADVQAQALNGAQVTALVALAQAVADNSLPPETAIGILLLTLPDLSREEAAKILKPADEFTPDKPTEAPAFPAQAPITTAGAP
jgi:SPP1 family phage portal protein